MEKNSEWCHPSESRKYKNRRIEVEPGLSKKPYSISKISRHGLSSPEYKPITIKPKKKKGKKQDWGCSSVTEYLPSMRGPQHKPNKRK
jgi:hypothetical protein